MVTGGWGGSGVPGQTGVCVLTTRLKGWVAWEGYLRASGLDGGPAPPLGFQSWCVCGGVSEQLCPRFNLRASCSQFNSGKRLQCNRPLTPRLRAAHPTPGPVSHPGLPDQSQAGSHEGQGLEASALPSPAAWALGLGFLLSEPGFQRACRTHATCI